MPRELAWMDVEDLRPNPENVKDHDLPGIEAAMDRLGYLEPIVIDERTGLLVSGHGRRESILAAKAKGRAAPEGVMEVRGVWRVPVHRGWASRDDDHARRAMLTLNRQGELGGYDVDKTLASLERIRASEAGLAGSGFSEDDHDDLMARIQESRAGVPDDPPPFDERTLVPGAGQVRTLVMDYDLDTFAWVAAAAARARAHFGVLSNPDLFLALLREAAA